MAVASWGLRAILGFPVRTAPDPETDRNGPTTRNAWLDALGLGGLMDGWAAESAAQLAQCESRRRLAALLAEMSAVLPPGDIGLRPAASGGGGPCRDSRSTLRIGVFGGAAASYVQAIAGGPFAEMIGAASRRRDTHSAAPPSPFRRCLNMDGEGMPVE